MSEQKFLDYYKILQVDPEAEQEVIKAAYRRLSALYHPDNSGITRDDRIKELNEAYSILGNVEKRSIYHKKWLERFTNRKKQVQTIDVYQKMMGRAGMDSARDRIENFFHALKMKNWDNAYMNLTEEDREHITQKEFIDWREAVSQCYEMQNYTIRFYKMYENCRIEETVYPKIAEFCVSVTDMDVKTLQNENELLHKYTAFDGVSWKICLGSFSIRQATMKYQLLAERKENYDPMLLYKGAINRISPLTGLLSKTGFWDEAEREIYRFKRYGNQFAIAVFQIKCKKKERETICFCHAAGVIRNSIRLSDLAGEIANNQIVCLFTETNQTGAIQASRKLIKKISEAKTEEYEVHAGIVEFQGYKTLDEAVFAAASKAAIQKEHMKGYKYESVCI